MPRFRTVRHQRLKIDHHVIALDRHRESLGDIRPLHNVSARLDIDWIGLDPEAFGIAVGLAGADVELPAVPGAADDFAERVYSISPGSEDCASPISGPSHSAAPWCGQRFIRPKNSPLMLKIAIGRSPMVRNFRVPGGNSATGAMT